MLDIREVNCGYGELKVLFDVSLRVAEGEIVALVGSNGAGKTTLLKAISGIIPLDSGKINFQDQEICSLLPYERARLGIIHIPQGRGILSTLTVYDNLVLGDYYNKLKLPREEKLEKVYELYPILKERRNQTAGLLSGGQQQMLAIARALMMEPKLMILDEPSLGLAPLVVKEVYKVLFRLKDENVSILLIEQNLNFALKLADRGYVLETGRVVLSGSSKELLANEHVKKAYLGI